jgi:hypothetical protein
MKGYSLIEVVIAVFILTGMVLASFSVFEMGSKESLKLENQMTAARLGQRIVEELHALYTSQISAIHFTHFQPPFQQYEYLYSVKSAGFLYAPNLQEIFVTVQGPVDSSGEVLIQGSKVSFTFLLARQIYNP